MPAVAILKTMPRSCIGCPFCGDSVFDELSCNLLDYNKVKYNLDIKDETVNKRRKECPLWFMEKGKTVIQIDEESLRK